MTKEPSSQRGDSSISYSQDLFFSRRKKLTELRLVPVSFLIVSLILTCSTVEAGSPRNNSETPPFDFEPEPRARHLEKNHTFRLRRTFRFPAPDELVQFLFEHPEVNASMVRAWNLLSLHVKVRGNRTYYTRIGQKLKGPMYKLLVESGSVQYVGKGLYRQDYLPFAIEGSALMELSWEPVKGGDTVDIKADLRLRPTSEVLHLIGTLLHPVAKAAFNDALTDLITLGTTLAKKLRNHPDETYERLKSRDETSATRWKEFLERDQSADDP